MVPRNGAYPDPHRRNRMLLCRLYRSARFAKDRQFGV
jgi:hypothetical protein